MNPAPFVHSALAMTRRLKRRDRCPARLALGCLEVAHTDGNQPSSTGRLLKGQYQKWITYSQIDADDRAPRGRELRPNLCVALLDAPANHRRILTESRFTPRLNESFATQWSLDQT
jgi:hypothetical protein